MHPMMKYVREGTLPTSFCSGCGIGTVQNLLFHAMDQLKIDPARIGVVCGIGCSGLTLSPYFKADTLHTNHGRPLPFATGLKVARPDLEVIVVSGDGDLAGIGGNHLIHAARRNIGLKVFCVNNRIYGNTGGQVAPTTPYGVRTVTTPYGNPEYPFDLVELMVAAGACFVARWTTAQPVSLLNCMKKALQLKGFTFVEIVSQCTTQYGRRVGLEDPVKFIRYLKERSVRYHPQEAKTNQKGLKEDEILVGEFIERKRKELTENLKCFIKEQGGRNE